MKRRKKRGKELQHLRPHTQWIAQSGLALSDLLQTRIMFLSVHFLSAGFRNKGENLLGVYGGGGGEGPTDSLCFDTH